MFPSPALRLVAGHENAVLVRVGCRAVSAATSGLVPVDGAMFSTPTSRREARYAFPVVGCVSSAAGVTATPSPVHRGSAVVPSHSCTVSRDMIVGLAQRGRDATFSAARRFAFLALN